MFTERGLRGAHKVLTEKCRILEGNPKLNFGQNYEDMC